MALSPLLEHYDQLIVDLDGCVWVGDEPTPGAVEALTALRAAGKHIAFHTNDPARSGEEFVRKLWRTNFLAIERRPLGQLQAWTAELQPWWGTDGETLVNYADSLGRAPRPTKEET